MRKVFIRSLKGKPSHGQTSFGLCCEQGYVYRIASIFPIGYSSYVFIIPIWKEIPKRCTPFSTKSGTRTGRLSCSNPNLLQIPKAYRQWKTCAKDVYCQTGDALG